MATDFTKYEVNLAEFQTFLKQAFKVTDNLKTPLKSISNDFYRSERLIFKLKSPGGYEDLSPSTKVSKQRKVGFLYPILKLTGRLERSITSSSTTDSILRIGSKTLKIGTKVPYGIFHQRGTRKIPQRQFVFIDGGGPSFPSSRIFQGRSERWKGIIGSHINQIYERRGWTS